jgi:hypothetical protein
MAPTDPRGDSEQPTTNPHAQSGSFDWLRCELPIPLQRPSPAPVHRPALTCWTRRTAPVCVCQRGRKHCTSPWSPSPVNSRTQETRPDADHCCPFSEHDVATRMRQSRNYESETRRNGTHDLPGVDFCSRLRTSGFHDATVSDCCACSFASHHAGTPRAWCASGGSAMRLRCAVLLLPPD